MAKNCGLVEESTDEIESGHQEQNDSAHERRIEPDFQKQHRA
jgi:hypothetical protein